MLKTKLKAGESWLTGDIDVPQKLEESLEIFKSKVLLPLFNSCCSGAMKAGVPMFSEHKTPRFRKRAKPKSDSFLGVKSWWNSGTFQPTGKWLNGHQPLGHLVFSSLQNPQEWSGFGKLNLLPAFSHASSKARSRIKVACCAVLKNL